MKDSKVVHILTGNTTRCTQYWVYVYTTEEPNKWGKIHTTINFIIDRFRRWMILTHWLNDKGVTKAISYPYKENAVIVLPVQATYKVCEKLEAKGYEVKKIFLMRSTKDLKDCPSTFTPKINTLCQ